MKTCLRVALLLACAASTLQAADINEATLRGRVLQVRNHVDHGGIYRVEVQLLTSAPSGGPWSPLFTCSALAWEDCTVENLIPGCTTVCENFDQSTNKFGVKVCHCPSFDPEAGVCLQAQPFHDGLGLLADAVTVLPDEDCSPTP